jgi:hypothetical protein
LGFDCCCCCYEEEQINNKAQGRINDKLQIGKEPSEEEDMTKINRQTSQLPNNQTPTKKNKQRKTNEYLSEA